MVFEANMRALAQAGFAFIVGWRIPSEPFVVRAWRKRRPGQEIPDGKVFVQPWDVGTKAKPVKCVIHCQYRAKRAKRDLRGIDKTLDKARRQISGEVPISKNRFLTISGGQPAVNEALVATARARAGPRAHTPTGPVPAKPTTRTPGGSWQAPPPSGLANGAACCVRPPP
jgi:hypothetical protein